MAIPVLTVTDDADVPITSGDPLVISNAPPGAITAVGAIRIQNAPAVDEAIGYGLLVLARRAGTGDELAHVGLEVLDSRIVRLAISSASPVGAQTSPRGMGGGVVQFLPTIPSGSFAELDVDVKVPAGVNVTAIELTFNVERVVSGFIGHDFDGLTTGKGDGSVSYVAETDGSIAANGPPDEFVQIPTATIVAQGVVIFEDAELLEFDDLDGSAQALVAGEEYAALISYSADGRTVTKGDKTSGTAVAPTTPVGHLARAVVTVPFGLVITTVVNLLTEGNFLATIAGLDLTVSGGRANVDRYEVRPQTPTVINFGALLNAETDVYVNLDGTFLTTPRGVPLTGRPLPLWRVTTDGATITGIVSLRDFAAGEGYS